MVEDTKYKNVVELLGMAAVVASLIFVGLEVRQNASATRGATQQQLSAAARESALSFVDPDIVELVIRGGTPDGWAGLTEVEQFRVRQLTMVAFRMWEDAYYQFSIGNLDADLWAGWEAGLSEALAAHYARDFWSRQDNRYHEGFRSLVDSLITTS